MLLLCCHMGDMVLHNHVSPWKNIEGSGRIILYKVDNLIPSSLLSSLM